MLIRKENGIEIWTDVPPKGLAKYCFIAAAIVAVILLCGFTVFNLDYMVKETYYFMIFWIGIPSSLFVIAGLISLNTEKRKSELVVKVNSNYIEIFKKNKDKKILMENLNKINKVISKYGSVIVFFYMENNKIYKYSLPVSGANKNLIEIAIKEYKKDLLISEIINGRKVS